MLKKVKKIGIAALSAGVLFAGIGAGIEVTDANKGNNGKVKNVIYMIPDGFSADYASNYRVYKGENAIWDDHLKGMFTTDSANSDITDSAAAGTAMATGVKTNNGVVGLDEEGNELTSILEAAEKSGRSSGLVATSTITHATPASFVANVESRNNEEEIAKQYLESEVDVILGGGKNNFDIEQVEESDFELVETGDELLNADINLKKDEKLLGLFANGAMAPELHRGETEEPSLAEMTETAIDVLEKDKDGFFLVVEGSQIDWAGHANDAGYAMTDAEAFEAAVAKAKEFANKDGKTLVVIAGDHDTGGMTTGSKGSMELNADILQNVTATGDYMAAQLNNDLSNISEVVNKYTGLTLTDKEVEYIKEANTPALAINTVVSDRANIGWTSTNHTGADIPVYAFGAQAEKFTGFHDNTDLPKIIAEAMKLKSFGK